MGTRDITARLNFHKGLFVRAVGFGMAAAAICGALALGSVLRDPPHALPQSVTVPIEQGKKDQARVGSGEPLSVAQTAPSITNVSIWHPGKMEDAPPDETMAAPVISHPDLGGTWLEQEFTSVSVVDGRTLSAGAVAIKLSGLELPPADQVCRTLDNRLEQCAVRAATQLELLTRSRTLACRYQMTTSSEAIGSCRIGSQDLAQRMVRTGYVRAAGAGRTVMANAKGVGAAAR